MHRPGRLPRAPGNGGAKKLAGFARWWFTPGRAECSECIEDEAEHYQIPDCAGCPLAGLHLGEANHQAWLIYPLIQDQVRFHFGGMASLDIRAVIAYLERSGQGPEEPEEWRELLDKLGIIHRARLEALAKDKRPNTPEGGEKEADEF